MSKISVYKINGSQNGEVELNPLIFDAEINKQLIQSVLTAYAGNQRRGTHDTKERKEVSGGGKKPWKQKGTGRARQGSIRAPQWRGGGTVFGPTPRDYDTKLSQVVRQKALICALSLKNKEENLMVVESFDLGLPKAKELRQAIDALKLDGKRSLCVVASLDVKLKRASNNLKEIFLVKRADDLNAYHVLRKKQLIIDRAALPLLEKRLLENSEPSNEKELVNA